jgi:hypothetical protein
VEVPLGMLFVDVTVCSAKYVMMTMQNANADDEG